MIFHYYTSNTIHTFPGNFRCFGLCAQVLIRTWGIHHPRFDPGELKWCHYVTICHYVMNLPNGQNTSLGSGVFRNSTDSLSSSTMPCMPSATRDSGGQDATKISILVFAWSSGSAPAANMKTCAARHHQQPWPLVENTWTGTCWQNMETYANI